MKILQATARGLVIGFGVLAAQAADPAGAEPRILGYGRDAFTLGERIYATDFSDRDNWVIQIEKKPESPHRQRVEMGQGILDIYVPDRGCTAWLKRKFSGPLTIVYQVRCPLETQDDEGIRATDINNFWHCSDPREGDAVLRTTATRYHGGFLSYHEMRGYYASTGGGRNRTTRLRRYPRWKDGQDVPHLALNWNDGKPEFLIEPGKWHTIQLVACHGLVQYIKDGQVVYQIREGDTVTVETRRDGKREMHETTYTLDRFPACEEGYFGFRMVGTHHQYRNLSIHRLKPVRGGE